MIELLGVAELDETLGAVPQRYELDGDALSAVAHAALRVPDRQARLEVVASA